MKYAKNAFIALLSTLCLAAPASANVSVHASIQQAFEYNPALKAAQAGQDAATYDVDRAKAGYYPTVGIWAGTGVNRNANSTSRAYSEQNQMQGALYGSIVVSQPLYSGGATTAQVAASRAVLAGSTGQLMDTATALAFEALSAHADLLRREKLLQLAKNNVAEHEKILSTTRQRFQQGVTTKGDVTQIESRLSRAKATATAQQAGLDAAKSNYMRVTGKQAPAALLPVEETKQVFANPEEALQVALAHNPRLSVARSSISLSQEEHTLAKSRYLPNLSTQASYNDRYQKGKSVGHTQDLEIGLTAQWEIFSGGADKANVARAAAKIRQATHELARYEDQLRQDLESTFVRTQAAIKQSMDYRDAMGFAKQSRQAFQEQFIAGQRGLLDVLDAESEFFNAASEEEVNRVDALLGQYRQLALAGTLLDALGVNRNFMAKPTTD